MPFHTAPCPVSCHPMEGKPITWRIRTCPKTARHPAEPERQDEAFYNPYEQEVMAAERKALDTPSRTEALNTIDTLHEFKVLLDAVIEPGQSSAAPEVITGDALREARDLWKSNRE